MNFGSRPFDPHVFICQCASAEHQFVFTFDPQAEHEECYLDVHLFHGYRTHLHSRIWHAAKYIGGYSSKHGDWDSTTVTVEDAIKLRDLLTKFISSCGRNHERPLSSP